MRRRIEEMEEKESERGCAIRDLVYNDIDASISCDTDLWMGSEILSKRSVV